MYRYDITTPCKDNIYTNERKANKKLVLAKLVLWAAVGYSDDSRTEHVEYIARKV